MGKGWLASFFILFALAFDCYGQQKKADTAYNQPGASFQSNSGKVLRSFKLTGSLSVQSRYASQAFDSFSFLPRKYVRVSFTPTVRVSGIPLSSTVYWSTDKGITGENLKRIGLSLNQSQLYKDISQRTQKEKGRIQNQIRFDQTMNKDISAEDFYRFSELPIPTTDILANTQQSVDKHIIQQLSTLEKLEALPFEKLSQFQDSLRYADPHMLKQLDSLKLLGDALYLPKRKYNKLRDSLERVKPEYAKQLDKLRAIQEVNRANPKYVGDEKEALHKLGLISKTESVLLDFRKLSVGDANPYYSPLTLMGLRVRGLDVRYTPKNLYLSLTGGTGSQIRSLSRKELNTLDNNILAGGIGWGKAGGTHLHVNYFTADRSVQNMSVEYLREYNKIYQIDIGYALGQQLSVSGEIASSQQSYSAGYYPFNITKHRNVSSTSDWAYSGALRYDERITKSIITAEYKRIGPNYITFGVPFLRTDLSQLNLKLNKNFFKQQIQTEVTWTKEEDNLSGIKPATSKMNGLGGTVSIALRKLPYVTVSYQPISQLITSEVDTIFLLASYKILNIQAGYQYVIGSIAMHTIGGSIFQRSNNTGVPNSAYSILYASQMVKLKIPILFSGTFTWSDLYTARESLRVANLEGVVRYTFNNKFTTSLGTSAGQLKRNEKRNNRFTQFVNISGTVKKNNRVECTYRYCRTTNSLVVSTPNNGSEVTLKYILEF